MKPTSLAELIIHGSTLPNTALALEIFECHVIFVRYRVVRILMLGGSRSQYGILEVLLGTL